MGKTLVSDIIIPTRFNRYVIERTTAKTALIRCGAMVRTPEFDALAAGSGRIVEMPFWKPLASQRQVLNDVNPMGVNRISSGKDTAFIHNDGNAWSVNDLAGFISGSDPLEAIGSQLSDYWAEENQRILLLTLAGIFNAPSMASNRIRLFSESIAGTTDANRLTGETFVDATQLLGDRADRLRTIVMHSAVEAALRKRDLLTYLRDSDGRETIRVFQGRTVLIDDKMPVRSGTTDGKVYTSYLFGPGAFAHGSAPLDEPAEGGTGTKGVEFARDALASDTIMINRRRHVTHPRGVRWTDLSRVGQSPDDDELADGQNWERVWEAKNILIAAIEHN